MKTDDILNSVLNGAKKKQKPKGSKNIELVKEFKVADKPVNVFNDKPIPKKSTIKDTYSKIPDDTNVPLQFMTRKQYMQKYVNNQEKKNGVDYSKKQKQQFYKNNKDKYSRITGRYTTEKNPYYEPAVVMFNDKSNQHNIKGENFKELAWHEYGHELAEDNNINFKNNKEEYFSDRIADIGMKNKPFNDVSAKNKVNEDIHSENFSLKRKKKQEPLYYEADKDYPEVGSEDFEEQQREREFVESLDEYGERRQVSGKNLGNTMIAVDSVLPTAKVGTVAGLGVRKYVDVVNLEKTDEHDRARRVPNVEVQWKGEKDKWRPKNSDDG